MFLLFAENTEKLDIQELHLGMENVQRKALYRKKSWKLVKLAL